MHTLNVVAMHHDTIFSVLEFYYFCHNMIYFIKLSFILLPRIKHLLINNNK